jgi:hypothetical protein
MQPKNFLALLHKLWTNDPFLVELDKQYAVTVIISLCISLDFIGGNDAAGIALGVCVGRNARLVSFEYAPVCVLSLTFTVHRA